MLWSLAHPTQTTQISQLLRTLCYRAIPSKYRKLILLPFVRLLLPGTKELKCGRHKHLKAVSSHNFIGAKGPREIYDVEEDMVETVDLVRVGNCRYHLDFSDSKLKLTSQVAQDGGGYDLDPALHKYILFDAFAPTETTRYPLFTCDVGLARVREIVDNSSDVFVMFVKRRGT